MIGIHRIQSDWLAFHSICVIRAILSTLTSDVVEPVTCLANFAFNWINRYQSRKSSRNEIWCSTGLFTVQWFELWEYLLPMCLWIRERLCSIALAFGTWIVDYFFPNRSGQQLVKVIACRMYLTLHFIHFTRGMIDTNGAVSRIHLWIIEKLCVLNERKQQQQQQQHSH